MSKEKSSTKTGIKFVIMMVCSAFVGGVFGFIFGMVGDITFNQQAVWQVLAYVLPIGYIAGNIFLFLLSVGGYASCKKKYKAWDGEDEELLDTLESRLDFPLIYTNVAMVFNMALFPTCLWLFDKVEEFSNWMSGAAIIVVILFFVGLAWTIAIQNAVIKLVKEINPEKRGSIFETDFQKTWLDSCDEAQKLTVYKCAYVSFQTVTMACMILWVIAVCTMFAFDTGCFPIICICVIFMTAILSYGIAAIKFESKK